MIKTLTAAAAAITLSTLASAQDPQGFIPPGQEGFAESFRVSPAIRAGNFVFISGVVGAIPLDRERTPEAYEAAIRSAFEDVETTLNASGTGWEDVVEMTTFHVDLRDHQTIFRRVREEFIVSEPYPAWTGIGVESLWGPALFVEIRVKAYLGSD
ncbi:MAG: Rid family hydrolase [Maricaulis sp.]|jgi:enamine deaminase RidA (YjgF/YER057c/UK114 family)|nr:Rid family hydrolase [Maricaulis sp.]MDG2044120.1 Rid family hydrolase [Maricaulis sp.]